MADAQETESRVQGPGARGHRGSPQGLAGAVCTLHAAPADSDGPPPRLASGQPQVAPGQQ